MGDFLGLQSWRQVVSLAAALIACLVLRVWVASPWYFIPLPLWLAGFVYFAFREYQRQVRANADVLASGLIDSDLHRLFRREAVRAAAARFAVVVSGPPSARPLAASASSARTRTPASQRRRSSTHAVERNGSSSRSVTLIAMCAAIQALGQSLSANGRF